MSATLDITPSVISATQVLELPALGAVRERLRAGAIVADVGARDASSTVAMAAAYPRSAFAGYDADPQAVAVARRRAAADGAGANARFEVAGADAIPAHAYDVVTTFAPLHELGDGERIARRVRAVLAAGGAWLLSFPSGLAEPVPHLLRALLERSGFGSVRIVAEHPSGVVLEARA
jgi:trans-aconitate methyltransferase